MKKTLLAAAVAISLCLLVTAGCSSDAEQQGDTSALPAQESAEQPLEPVAGTSEPNTSVHPAPVSADLSKEPPYLHVVYGDDTLDTHGWNWTWTVQNADGTAQTLEPEHATAYPLDWVDIMDTLVKSDGKTLTLSFEVEPDTVTAYADVLSGGPHGGPVALENGTDLPLPDDTEGIVYTIHAEWNGANGYQGDSYYAFCVKAK